MKSRMNRKTLIWAGAAAAVLVLVAGFVGGRGATSRPGGSRGSQDLSVRRARATPTVAVGRPRRTDLPRTLALTASISSETQAVVIPKTSGYLLAVTVRPGDPVRAGQVVAIVDHAQLDAQVSQAQATLVAAQSAVQTAQAQVAAARAQRANTEAGLASAQAGLVKAQAQLADTESSYRRTAALAKEGAVSQQSLDDAKAQVVSAQATVDAARAQVEQARAQVEAARQQEAAAASQVKTQQAQAATQAAVLDNARLALGNATITAPFSGVVVSRTLDAGAYVAPGTSTPILTIADPDHLNVLVNVSEPDLPLIRRGQVVQIRVDAYPAQGFEGRVTRIAGGVDPQTRTTQVEVHVANPGHMLRPGMYAKILLAAGTHPALVVPLSSLVSVGPQKFLWVVQDDKVTQRNVTIGQASGDVVEITSGVTPDDEIVVRGIDMVREGQQIRAVPATPGAGGGGSSSPATP